ncbi:6878_t:CDS:2, partial [Acaulospora colombiana]
ASMSQADLTAPPAPIAEEPEPTTPIPPVSEMAKDIHEAAPNESKEVEEFPKADVDKVEAPTTLAVPTADGSRFIEGSSPGTRESTPRAKNRVLIELAASSGVIDGA